MGLILQKFLRALAPDGEHPHPQHVTAALGCCSTIRIDEHEHENTQPIQEDESSSE